MVEQSAGSNAGLARLKKRANNTERFIAKLRAMLEEVKQTLSDHSHQSDT